VLRWWAPRAPTCRTSCAGLAGNGSFSTQEGTLYPLLSNCGAKIRERYRVPGIRRGARRKLLPMTETAGRSCGPEDYWKLINRTISDHRKLSHATHLHHRPS